MSQFPKLYRKSALIESSLSELYGQLAQMMRSLERRVLAWDANAPTSDESLARFEQFLSTPPHPTTMAAPPAQPREASQPPPLDYMAQPLEEGQGPMMVQQVGLRGSPPSPTQPVTSVPEDGFAEMVGGRDVTIPEAIWEIGTTRVVSVQVICATGLDDEVSRKESLSLGRQSPGLG